MIADDGNQNSDRFCSARDGPRFNPYGPSSAKSRKAERDTSLGMEWGPLPAADWLFQISLSTIIAVMMPFAGRWR
jgi:hypothetical protein